MAGFSPTPAYVKCYSGFSAETLSAIHNACVAWNGTHSRALVYRNTELHSNTRLPYENNVNEITKSYEGTGASAYLMTTYDVRTSSAPQAILGADININVSYDWGTASTSYNTLTLITHEIVHLLGLDHSSVRAAMMYPTLSVGEVRTIHNDDRAGIAQIYNVGGFYNE